MTLEQDEKDDCSEMIDTEKWERDLIRTGPFVLKSLRHENELVVLTFSK